MNPTVLITGASSGIGRATAVYFHQQGWNVAATMRSPEQPDSLPTTERLVRLRLDVTEPDSIQQAIDQTIQKFGKIDALVNNAGYSVIGVFESSTKAQIEKQFATNVFGLMETTRAILPHFRQQQQGTIINVASMGGRLTSPLYSLYHATKWAVEGFSESLQYELQPLNIKVKIIEPGAIKTDFYDRSADPTTTPDLPQYQRFVQQVMPQIQGFGINGSVPEVVAHTIFRATTDGRWTLRYVTGSNAALFLMLRRILPDSLFQGLVRSLMIR